MAEANEDCVIIDLKAAHRLLRFGHSLDHVAKRFDVETDGLRDALEAKGYKVPRRAGSGIKAERPASRLPHEEQERLDEFMRGYAEAEAGRKRSAVRRAEQQNEQQRLDELARRYAKVRDTAAAYRAEVGFERRERARLAEWLKQYADVLTG